MTEEITTQPTAGEQNVAAPSSPQGHTGSARGGAEKRAEISWVALLQEAVTKPGYIHEAYSRFWNYSLGNQLLALFECLARGVQPGPLATFLKWKELGRHVRKGERAITLCMPVTRKLTKTVKKDDGTEQEEDGAFTAFLFKAHWFTLETMKKCGVLTPQLMAGSSRARCGRLVQAYRSGRGLAP